MSLKSTSKRNSAIGLLILAGYSAFVSVQYLFLDDTHYSLWIRDFARESFGTDIPRATADELSTHLAKLIFTQASNINGLLIAFVLFAWACFWLYQYYFAKDEDIKNNDKQSEETHKIE